MSGASVIYHVIRYLQHEAEGANVTESQNESIDVAIECLVDAYDIALDDEEACARLALPPPSLLEALTKAKVFEPRCQPKIEPPSSPSESADQAEKTKMSVAKEVGETKAEEDTDEAKQRTAMADAHKQRGNRHIKDREFSQAVEEYTKAIAICPDNAVYYGNRAAAFSGMESNDEAIKDCERSLLIDPKYVKAHSRMGNALLNKGEYSRAAASYQQALAIDPTNQIYVEQLALAERRLEEENNKDYKPDDVVGIEREAENEADVSTGMAIPDLSKVNMEKMPDLSQVNLNDVMSSVMNNPDMLRVAQGMMANPQMMNMAQNVLGQMGGGQNIQEMMAGLDPSVTGGQSPKK